MTPNPTGTARSTQERVPEHSHVTLGSLTATGAFLALAAFVLGITALVTIANREPVDNEVVTALVNQRLADVPVATTILPVTTTTAPSTGVGSDQPVVSPGAGLPSVIPELTPKAELAPVPGDELNVAYAPAVPPAATRTDQRIVDVHFEIVENVVTIDAATGVQFETWGYRLAGDEAVVSSGTPGPMIRARVGDLLRFTLTNPETNALPHSVDFHAVTGQGGGAADTLVAPGESAVIEARALYPGIFMYHCAAGDVPAHVAHGMYGGILIDPEVPIAAADREFYIVQSEYYTDSLEQGVVALDRAAMTDEQPTMVVFNGAKGALTGDNVLQLAVGERARIYFVNAGLNLDSNFHPIGSHWDAVWPEGALLAPPIRGSQTTLVPAGGGVVVDLVGQVPANIILVDHALTRAFDKGAIGIVAVSGTANPEIFEAAPAESATATDTPVGDVTVTIAPGAFTPQELDDPTEFDDGEDPVDYSVNLLTIEAGTTVTWVNDDEGQVHTVTDVGEAFDSGFLATGESWSWTFETPGEYEYYCLPHPWMRAKITVTG